MSQTNYAVCHLQRGGSNGSGLSCHIERQTVNGKAFVPENADASRTHLNRELIIFPDGVHNRTQAIQHRIDHAGLKRKVGKNQTTHICIILSGTHEQMMKLEEKGKIGQWCEANLKWLKDSFGEENVVSCVLHMDEKTPHLHATVVPIVNTPRKRRVREGEEKYKVKRHGFRLSCDDMMSRVRLKKYQDTYGVAMKAFGLERGIVGSTAKHKSTQQYAKDVQCSLEAVEKEMAEKKNGIKAKILDVFGSGELADAKRAIAERDAQIDALKVKCEEKDSKMEAMAKEHKKEVFDITKLYHQTLSEREEARNEVDRLKTERKQLLRKAYPERFRLSSGASLQKLWVLGESNPSLRIQTRVGDVENTASSYAISHLLLSRYEHGELTEEELVNEVFLPEEQINECQMSLLVAMLNVASGGPATPHVGTGGGGGSSDLPWNDKKKRGHFR